MDAAIPNDDEVMHLVSILRDYLAEPISLEFHIGLIQPKKDDTRVRIAEMDGEFAEIAVAGDENALLAQGNRKDLFIGQSGRIILPDRGHIVRAVAQERRQAKVGALIEKKFHA